MRRLLLKSTHLPTWLGWSSSCHEAGDCRLFFVSTEAAKVETSHENQLSDTPDRRSSKGFRIRLDHCWMLNWRWKMPIKMFFGILMRTKSGSFSIKIISMKRFVFDALPYQVWHGKILHTCQWLWSFLSLWSYVCFPDVRSRGEILLAGLDFFQHLSFGVCATWNSGRQESSTATAVGSHS